MTDLTSSSAATTRRDNLPVWVIVLLIVFAGQQLYDLGIASGHSGRSALQKAQASESTGNVETMQDIVETDLQAKTAFVVTFGKPGGTIRPDVKALHTALRAAEQLQKSSDNAPSAARRVILLRSLLGLAPLTPGRNKIDSLAAFDSALPPTMSALDRAQYSAEGLLWKRLFQGKGLSPNQVQAVAAQIRAIPGIRWWTYPALMALYTAQGDLSEANRYAGQARTHAILTMVPVGLENLALLGLALLGVLLLGYFFVRGIRVRNGHPMADIWPTVPSAIAPEARRLGAGDLMSVFVLYLLTREIITIVLVGVTGSGLFHRLSFPGLMTPFLPALQKMPATQRATVGILLEAVAYLLSALPPVVYLVSLARRRGASLADEIGWSRRRLGLNLIYGVGGYAIALPLIIIVGKVAPQVFRHAPAPSNPVIPQLINASGVGLMLMLVLLATVAAPLVEELLFRGVFYNAAKLRLGVWPAIVLTGLVFGFIHPVGIAEMLAIAMLGGVFAWMAETRKSLVPSMLAHCLQNLSATVLLLLVISG